MVVLVILVNTSGFNRTLSACCLNSDIFCVTLKMDTFGFTHVKHTMCNLLMCHILMCHILTCHILMCHILTCHLLMCHILMCHILTCHILTCHVLICHILMCFVYHVAELQALCKKLHDKISKSEEDKYDIEVKLATQEAEVPCGSLLETPFK